MQTWPLNGFPQRFFEATHNLRKVCPPEWNNPLDQILVHTVFGTWKENLAVIEWAFGRRFDERSKWGSPQSLKDVSKCKPFKYSFGMSYFSKPQKDAPRNIGPAHSQQLSNVVVMRGKRNVLDNFTDISEVVKMKPAGNNLMQQLQSPFKTLT
jgi:hypothetical protein